MNLSSDAQMALFGSMLFMHFVNARIAFITSYHRSVTYHVRGRLIRLSESRSLSKQNFLSSWLLVIDRSQNVLKA